MSKYEELARLSIEHSKLFHEAKERCEHAAWKLAKEISEYLAAPGDALRFVQIDRDLHFGATLGNVLGSSPEMTYGIDGFWYFGIELHFKVADTWQYFGKQKSLFGLKQRGTTFVIRHSKDVAIDLEKREAVQSFLEEFEDDLRRFYSTPPGEQQPRIGFAAPGIASEPTC